MAEKVETMKLDDGATAPAPMVVQGDPADGRDADGVPYCTVHHCRMTATSSGPKGGKKAYYACPVTGCRETGVKVKAAKRVPQQPLYCPLCRKAKKEVACERDRRRSRNGAVILVCQTCGWVGPALTDPRIPDTPSRVRPSYGER